MKRKLGDRILSIILSVNLVFNNLAPFVSLASTVRAQDVTPQPTAEATVSPTENPTPTIEVSPTETVSPTVEPTLDVSPTPTVEVSPTVVVTPFETVTPVEQPTLAPTEAPSVPSPPQELNTPTSTITPTPEVLMSPKIDGHVDTSIVESYSCRSDSLNGCLATNKPDYAPTEVAVITGYGFSPTTIYTIRISSSDAPAVTFEKEITTDATGSFTYSYQLDGTYRPNYLVELKDSAGFVVASVTFTDSESSAGTIPFSDTFGAVNSDTVTNWDEDTSTGTDQTKLISSGGQTTGFVQVGGSGGWIRRTINATGFYNLQLKYYWKDDADTESSDYGRVEYCLGATCTTFTELTNHQLGNNSPSWNLNTINLPSSLDNTTFRIRFTADTSKSDESFNVDDVTINQTAGITIIKDSQPDDAQDFSFTTTGSGLSNFSLDDDANATLSNTKSFSGLTAGSYIVQEEAQSGFDVTAINCTDPTSNSTVNLGTRTATINLAATENVVCTFVNTKRGHIIVTKDAVPNDAQDFSFTNNFVNGNPASFNLDDDLNGTLSNTRNSEVLPGTYSVSEDAVSGWTSNGGICDDGSPVNAIQVSAGETVTCTFTNTLNQPDLTATKTNDVGGNATTNQAFNWKIRVQNSGAASATFASGNTILTDNLPNSNVSYGSVTVTKSDVSVTGTIACSISSSNLSCTASGGSVVIPVGQYFDVSFPVTFSTTGSKVNPRSGNICKVDPTSTNGVVTESNEGNNTCTDTVTVAAVQPVANPTLPQACGLDIALVLDVSGSIDATELSQMKTAMTGLVTALSGTPTEFSVTKFDTTATVVQGFSGNTGTVNTAINGVSGGGYTNWQDGLTKGNSTLPNRSNPNLLIFASDGQPNTIGNGPGNNASPDGSDAAMNPAITMANTIKTGGTRILGIGIGLNSSGTDNMKQISGPNADTGDFTTADLITTNFSTLASQLATFASDTCGGTITVHKTVTGEDNPTLSGWHFTVDGQDYVTNSQGFTQAIPVSPGTYSVVETTQNGYSLTSKSCTKNNLDTGSLITNGVGSISVGANDVIACSFTNDKNPTTGTLKVKKVVVNDNGGIENANDFTFKVDDGSLVTFTQSSDNLHAENDIVVTAGSHSVTEPAFTGYATAYDNCSNVNVPAGGSATCTITNNDIQPKLTVTKIVSGGTAQVSDFTLKVGNTVVTSGVKTGFNSGSYTVSESGSETSLYDASFSDDCATDGSINLNIGDDKTCTITNTRKTGYIRVEKLVDPGTDSSTFHFDLTAEDGQDYDAGGYDLGNGNNGAYVVPSQQYTLGEAANSGYITYYQCADLPTHPYSGPVNYSAPVQGNSVTFTLQDNHEYWCRFINTKKPTLTINKVCEPLGDTGKFNLQIDDQNKTTDTICGGSTNGAIEVTIGTHKVGETAGSGTNIDNYTSIISGNCAANGNITLAAGENKTCTITNTRKGSISGAKLEDADGNVGDASDQTGILNWVIELYKDCASDFTGCVLGTSTNTAANGTYSFTDLIPGYYQVKEVLLSGWTALTNLFHNVTVAPGEQETSKNFVNFKNVSVTACKQEDPDGNIDTPSGRTNVVGWHVNLMVDGQPTSPQVTGENGCYTWSDLGPGHYGVGESVSSGWTNLTSTNHDFGTVSSGSSNIFTFINSHYGKIIVKKVMVGVTDTFSFTGDVSGSISTNNGTLFTANVLPGHQYTSVEGVKTGWDLTDLTCDDANSSGDKSTRTATFNVEAGETVTCTFTNTVQKGSISIIKDAQPDSTQIFGFTGDLGGFNLDDNGNNNDTYSNTKLFSDLLPGTYTVTEPNVQDWTLDSINCQGGSDVNPNNRNVVIKLKPGENVTCTFVNKRDTGTVVVHKDVKGPNGENVTDTSTNFTVRLDNANSQTVTDNGTVTYNDVTTGNHSVTEFSPPSNYTYYSITPDSNSNKNDGAQITVTAGQTTDVYIVNRQKQATVHVVKDVRKPDGSDTSDNHSFTVQLNGGSNRSLAENDSEDYNVNPGTYTIAELDDPNYTEMGCKLSTGAPATEFNVTSNQSVTITCTNKQMNGTINVVKDVKKADGITDVSDNHSFTAKLDGSNSKTFSETVTAVYTSVVPGSHTITENSDSNYVYAGCTPDSNNNQSGAQVNVGSNQTVNVTCVNKQLPASIKIIKDAKPNSNQDFGFTRNFGGGFTLDDDGNNNNTHSNNITFNTLNSGTYTVTESGVSGWALTGLNCTGGQTQANGHTVTITVTPGQDVVCTFTNTEYGKITGEKFNDKNGNNHEDSGEPDLSGWKMFIDQNNNSSFDQGEPTDTTNGSGNYSFENLLPGTYKVCEVPQEGWYSSLPNQSNCQTTTISSDGGDEDTLKFGNHQALTINAYKIVCDKESDLPNWGNGGPDVTSTTAQNFLNSHENCHLQSGWDFQYGLDGQVNKYGNGDQLGAAPSPWQTLGTTSGSDPAQIKISNLHGASGVWVREVLQSNYVPFSYPPAGPTSNNFSAELYCYKDVQHYDNFDLVDAPLYGNTYNCVAFNALNYGKLNVHKFEDLNNNGTLESGENGVADFQMGVYEGESCEGQVILNGFKNTDANGDALFENLTPGTYSVKETEQAGWQRTTPECQSVEVVSNQTANVDVGNVHYGKVQVTKYDDKNKNGQFDDGEKVLSGWDINLDKSSKTTDENGHVLFEDLQSGSYDLSENIKDGWKQTNISCDQEQNVERIVQQEPEKDNDNSHSVNVQAGQTTSCFIGNYKVPHLHISKYNDTTGDESPGGKVKYKLVLDVLDNDLFNVNLKDLLPKGFSFDHIVSATDNGSPLTYTFTGYHSPATYGLGDLKEGDQVVIEYEANIDGSQPLGLYKDLAWSAGNGVDTSDKVLAQSQDGAVTDTFVGTSVRVNGNLTEGGNANIANEGQVLGASTELPATGGNSVWMLIASALSILGLLVFAAGLMIKKGKLLVISLFMFGLFMAGQVNAASNVSIRLAEPKTPTRINNFKIGFVALDMSDSGNPITVKCFYKKNLGDSWTQYGPDIAVAAPGNNGECQEVSSFVNTSGQTYYFKATATNGVDSDDTESQSLVAVGYDDRDPSVPTNFHKEKISSCQYKITFKTADDGQTSRVEVYRSDSTTMSLDGSTRVADINIGPNTEGSFTESVPDCNKTYYYVLRAFNVAGNASGPTGDSVTITSTTTVVTTPAEGAIPVANANIPGGAGGQVLGEKTKEGEVLGEASPSAKPEIVNMKQSLPSTVLDFVTHKKKLTLLILAVAAGLGYAIYYAFKKASQNQ